MEMKIPIQKKNPAEIKRNFPIDDRLDGWFFRVEEKSNSCCEASGTDLYGRMISRTGVDPDLALQDAVADARMITDQIADGRTNRRM